jgi:hypothetical protein
MAITMATTTTTRFWQVAFYYTFLTIMSWSFYELAQEYYIDFNSTYWYYLFFVATLFFATLIILYQERYMTRTVDKDDNEIVSRTWKNELVIYLFGALVFIFIITGGFLSTFNSTISGFVWVTLCVAVFLTILITTLQSILSIETQKKPWVKGLMFGGVLLYSILYIVAIILLFLYYSPPIWVYTPLIVSALMAIIAGMLEIWGAKNIFSTATSTETIYSEQDCDETPSETSSKSKTDVEECETSSTSSSKSKTESELSDEEPF